MSRRILIVEDEAYLAELLSDVLKGAGYEVVLTTASRAVERALDLHPEAIVMDYLLPGITGDEVGRQIRAAIPNAPPVVLVSGLPNVRDLAQQSGFDAYLRKPFDVDDFVRVIDNVTQ